ncbi:MAG: TIGR03663 family protein [Phycisphaerales bacterium]|nr:MAG: TIGR03663 family protein [Phycisphaerales bacterium]
MKLPDSALSNPGARLSWLLILIVALGAFASRVPRLSLRPMHTDEAVHADKFGDLLEAGDYQYDPNEYHGPTLNYFTLISARLSGARKYTEISEVTLRIVPVVFSALLIGLTVFLARGLGVATIPVALLVAISPAMFFYSRYYIQETLLVCFTFGAIIVGYRYAQTKALRWAAVAGVFVGLMHATKETCIIALGSMALAWGLVVLIGACRGRPWRTALQGVRPLHLVVGLATAIVVSAVFCSSFFSHPRGVLDSYLTYANYFSRGAGHDTTHVHPWYYFLHMLLFARYAGGPIWTEGWIVLLALVGAAVAVRGRPLGKIDATFVRFLALYTLVLVVVYSAIPYKTPWCLLSFLHGLILLAGVGAVALVTWLRQPAAHAVAVALLVAAAAHLAWQAYRGSFVYQADSRNPYVYAHPTDDIFTVVDKITDYVGIDGVGESVPIDIVCSGSDYWPLPWYLRGYAVRWSSEIPAEVGPLVVISAELENALSRRLYVETPREQIRMYMYLFDDPYYVWFRPQVKLVGFVRKDLSDHYQQRPDPAALLEGQRDQATGQTGDAVRPQ